MSVWVICTHRGDWEELAARVPGVLVLDAQWCLGRIFQNRPRAVLMRYWYREDFANPRRAAELNAVESWFRGNGVRVFNPWSAHELAYQKHLYYPRIPSAPPHLVDPAPEDLKRALKSGYLRIPLVIRPGNQRDRSKMWLVSSLEECLEKLKQTPPPAMIVQYIPDSFGEWRAKCRAYVLGGRVDMAVRVISDDWIVTHPGFQSDGATPREGSIPQEYLAAQARANRGFRLPQQAERSLVQAGRDLGLDVFSADVLLEGDRHYIIDINASYSYLPLGSLGYSDHQRLGETHVRRVIDHMRRESE